MIILTETGTRENLFPFTHTRHTADIRIGILTIRQKWEILTGEKISTAEDSGGIHIPANIIPTADNFQIIVQLIRADKEVIETEQIQILRHPRQIFELNDFALRKDFDILTKGKISAAPDASNKTIQPENIFIEKGAKVSCAVLNASTGPIYIGADAEIMEGCLIRGPFSLGEKSVVKMGTKVYGATTIGPGCVAGGEIKNSVFFANSNKAHDGYLGDSVLGEWCNLGAGSSNSNVKNTGGNVGYKLSEEGDTVYGGNKGGLLMGDYSRAAINTSFNTGSVVGVCCNIFEDKMPAKFTENFAWGKERYIFEKALIDIVNWKKMKGQTVSEDEINMLKNLYDQQK